MTISAIGLDLSLTSTGVASDTFNGRWRPPCMGVERLAWYRSELRDFLGALASGLSPNTPLIAAIEGYSYASENSHAHSIGEVGGIVRLVLRDYAIPTVTIPPSCLKKYATGRGTADKEAVLSAAVLHTQRSMTNDEADAWWLRAMTLDHYGLPPVAMPAANRAVLRSMVRAAKGRPAHPAIDWPTLRAA